MRLNFIGFPFHLLAKQGRNLSVIIQCEEWRDSARLASPLVQSLRQQRNHTAVNTSILTRVTSGNGPGQESHTTP